MIYYTFLLFIIGISLFIWGCYSLFKANKIEHDKLTEYIVRKTELENAIEEQNNKFLEQEQKIKNSLKEHSEILITIEEDKKRANAIYDEEVDKINKQINIFKEKTILAKNNYFDALEKDYEEAEQKYHHRMNNIKAETQAAEYDLTKLKNSLAAGINERLREQEREQQSEFYTLQLSDRDKYEINVIKSVEPQLANPRPLRMLIWTNYYSKKANDLASRILGKDTITGIYKITSLKTKQCYIGQAVDVRERWREHCKCGLGIDTPAANKLYQAMLLDGLDNFTFELLEKCSKTELNEKEKFFIDLYSSYDYGFNSTKGNK